MSVRVQSRALGLVPNKEEGDSSDEELILIVDDDEQMHRLLQAVLDVRTYRTATATTAAEADAVLARDRVSLMLCDVNFPGESGLDLVWDVTKRYPETAIVMVSAVDDAQLAEEALALGAYGYVVKPFRPNELLINVTNALLRRNLELENRRHKERLEQAVLDRTVELRRTVAQLESSEASLRVSREETIQRLSYAAEFRSMEVGEHIERVSKVCALVAARLGRDAHWCELLRVASPMHDVGKIGIPDRILLKEGPLTSEEWTIMKQHTVIGHRILSGSGSEILELAATTALTHHERFDGTGYPRGLAGTAIPLAGRIVAVADVFDALTHDRVYRPAYPFDRALEMMGNGRGDLFDPDVLDPFLSTVDQIGPLFQVA